MEPTLNKPNTSNDDKQHLQRITRNFRRACAEYGLLSDGDKVLVALSGGKDSLMLVRLLAQQMRIHKPSISVEAAHVLMDNIPYDTDRSHLQRFCDECGMPLHILHTKFDERQSDGTRRTNKPRCFLCSWHRRRALFEFATANGFTKVALGHHRDDFLVTMLMNLTFEGNISAMKPMMPMRHYPISVIRPLCLVAEDDISVIAESQGFVKQKVPCPYESETMRAELARVFRHLETLNPDARYSMWHALEQTWADDSEK